ncbi:DUF1178 family protein [Ampullimonas aquatilis]|uniref:DUF1178 family protein n=1 Tax=Ampullimonas aquatilis TaxID=1341549 RepID=UPI003C734E59
MKVFNLTCSHEHRFEGWFASEHDFSSQMERGLVSCPLCDDHAIRKLPTAPRLNLGGGKEPATGSELTVESQPAMAADGQVEKLSQQNIQQFLLEAVRHVIANTEDVGDQFASEARRMHRDETEIRNIRGQVSHEDREQLLDEGIEVMSLPMPELLKKVTH